MSRALVIGRRRKGRPIASGVRAAERGLADAGWRVDSELVDRKRELRRETSRAVKHGYDAVVVVGGDGAVGQVATKLMGSGVALGIIPAGTGNLLAANLRIPDDPREALRTIVQGRVRRIDVGRLECRGRERAFTVACGIGFDAEVMDATARSQKLRWGQLAYLANAVTRTSSLRNVPHRLELDGAVSEMDAAQVFVANFGRMLPLVTPRPPVRPDDGLFDVIVVSASGPLPALLAGWEAIRGDGFGESASGRVFRAHAREVRVEAASERLVEIDGSVAGTTPIGASIVPRGLSVIVPKR